jgi:tRNA(Ile)-lysidine synthase
MSGDLKPADPQTAAAALDLPKLFAPLRHAKACLLAVSGGPDSLALMRLAAAWRATAETPPLSVATVDHGLRLEARAEAEAVAATAFTLGLDHTTLTWTAPKPERRLQERARNARYDLLLQHALAIGADHIVTAHHADDQAETILFRLARGSGIGGLAGMRTARALGPVTLARPLLGLTKADLVAICTDAGQAYVEDPSNIDPRYSRGRLRQLAPHLAALGLDREALLRLGRRAARADIALDATTRNAAAQLPALRTAETFSVPAQALMALPSEILMRLLDDEISRVGQSLAPLRLERLERLTANLDAALETGSPFAATLGGTALRLDGRGRLTIGRAPPRRAVSS